MKVTGIIRRIDNLGRIVIPKEFRRKYAIEDYDFLELFASSEGGIVIKKHFPLSSLGNNIPEYAETLHWALGCDTLICDKDAVIAFAGSNCKYYVGKEIHDDIRETIYHGNSVYRNHEELLNITSDSGQINYEAQVITPIRCNEHPVGTIILLFQQSSPETLNQIMKLADTIAHLIERTINY